MGQLRTIGRYEIVRHLATGGMGRVYLAKRPGVGGFERHVVVKTLDMTQDESFIDMFLDEARVLGRMHHQHIASLFEIERTTDGKYFLVLDFVHGHNALAVWDRALDLEAGLPLDFALTVGAACASALNYAHTRTGADGKSLGIVHRDVSLANLMIGYDGAVKLIDFGIAKAVDRSASTQIGYVKGKLGYMAPEQVNGGVADHRTDIFALGVVLYELTTMVRPFRGKTELDTLMNIRKGEVVPPSEIVAQFPRGLELIIMKALRPNREARFQDADSMRRELEAFGHRHKLVMGDSAVVEVMGQLFDNVEPWSEPAAEASPNAIPHEISNHATVPVEADTDVEQPRTIIRNLRAATELADQMIIELTERVDAKEDPTAPIGPAQKLRQKSPPPIKPVPARTSDVMTSAPRPADTRPTSDGAVMIAPPSRPTSDGAVVVAPPSRPSWPEQSGVVISPAPARMSNVTRGALISALTIGIAAVIPLAIDTFDTPELSVSAAPAGPVVQMAAARPSPPPTSHIAPTPPPNTEPPKPADISIKITTTPADATVLLDGQRLGHTPFDGTVPAASGPHSIKIRRRGFATMKLDVDLTANIVQTVTLQPAPPGA